MWDSILMGFLGNWDGLDKTKIHNTIQNATYKWDPFVSGTPDSALRVSQLSSPHCTLSVICVSILKSWHSAEYHHCREYSHCPSATLWNKNLFCVVYSQTKHHFTIKTILSLSRQLESWARFSHCIVMSGVGNVFDCLSWWSQAWHFISFLVSRLSPGTMESQGSLDVVLDAVPCYWPVGQHVFVHEIMMPSIQGYKDSFMHSNSTWAHLMCIT